jgi:hypothetical protein
MLLAMAERRQGIADRLARSFPNRRDPSRITHTLADMIRTSRLRLDCAYERRRRFGQPACRSRVQARLWQIARDRRRSLFATDAVTTGERALPGDAIRLTYALVDQWMASYEREPASVILDIDDNCDVVQGPSAAVAVQRAL